MGCTHRRLTDYAGPDQGWVSLFVVDPAYGDGAASDLLATVKRFMAERGVSSLRFGGDTSQFLPGVPVEFTDTRAAFRDHGFEPWITYDLFTKEVSK